jgi:hypothetical protein
MALMMFAVPVLRTCVFRYRYLDPWKQLFTLVKAIEIKKKSLPGKDSKMRATGIEPVTSAV